MIRLVEPSAPPFEQVAETTLAAVTRQALRADAALVVESSLKGEPRLLAADGLSQPELATVLSVLAGGVAPSTGVRVAVPGFPVSLYEEAELPKIGAAAVCALWRRPSPFKHAHVARAFARHAAVACGAHRRSPRLGPAATGAEAVDVLAIAEADNAGYDELGEAIMEAVRRAAGATGIGVFVHDETQKVLRPFRGAFGTNPHTPPPAHACNDWASSAARVFATGEPYLSNHAAGDPGVLQDHVEEFGFERLITVPLTAGRRHVGVLQAINKPTDFTFQDLEAAAALGPGIAVAVQVARMRERLGRRQRLEEILGELAIEIASGRDLQEFLGTALDALCAAVDGSMIALVPRAGEPVIRRRFGTGGYLEQVVIGQATHTTSLRVYGLGPRRAGEAGWATAHVPVLLSGEQVATLSVLRTGVETFEADECRALSRMASLVALAWATEQYQRQLADSARVAERQRIADELHDQVAQLLFAARLSLDFAGEIPGLPDAAASNIRRGRDLVLRADQATRQMMEQNSQESEERLSDRLAALIGSVEEEFARPVTLEIAPAAQDAAARISRPALNLVARAAREALVNAAKHAGPCQLAVRVSVTRRNRLLLTVTDGGIGVGPRREDGYGTAALRRAVRRQGGVLRVNEVSTGGTKFAVSVPL